MKRKKLITFPVFILNMLIIPVTADTVSTDTAQVTNEGSLLSTDDTVALFAIILCVLVGIIISFYIIYKMKNKH